MDDQLAADEGTFTIINGAYGVMTHSASDTPQAGAGCPDIGPLWTKWFGGRTFGEAQWDASTSIAEVLQIYGLSPTDPIDPTTINDIVRTNTDEIVDMLQKLDQSGAHDGNPMLTTMIRLILKKLEASKKFIVGLYNLYAADTLQPSDLPPDDYGLWRFTPNNPDAEPNAGQRARIYALNDLGKHGFKRYRGNIMYRILNPDGLITCAWGKYQTIDEYTRSLTEKRFSDPQLWLWLTNGAGYQPVNQLTEFLEKSNDPEVPFIDPDRHVFSFRNGVYLAMDEIFVPYTDLTEVYRDKKLPVACKHFDIEFDSTFTEYEDPLDIPTPGIETIFTSQEFTPIIKRWVYCLLGRLLYDVREMDDWQIVPFFKGLANTGKSLILNIVKEYYEDHDIGTISNTIEKQFGIGQIAGKFLAVGDDLRENFQMDQSDFQNIVSGNGVSCAVKLKGTRIEKPWKTSIVLSGNVVPAFQDNSGSVGRRMAVVLCPKTVEHPDGSLFDKMKEEMPAFICKCNRMYRNMLRRYGNKGIWEILPADFQDQRMELTASTNALAGFLSSNLIRRTGIAGEELYISMDTLRDAVTVFAMKNNMSKPIWTPDFYRGPLALAGFKITKATDRKKYPRHGERVIRGPFVLGFDLEIACELAEQNGREAFARVAAPAPAAMAADPPPSKRART
jgi:hypothetical protein